MEGKYQAYPEYKKSEIKWFGSIPIGWGIAPLRRSLVEHKQGYYTTDSYVDDGVKLLRITDLRDYGEIDIRYCPQVSASDQSLANFELKDGDVIFARTGGAGSFGVVRNLSERVVFASYLIRFRFYDSHFENGYLRYMLLADSFQKAVKQNIHGGVNQNIHAEDIKNSYLARPSIGEQRKIANFLDHETAKIDTLIEKQQQLIKLLKEKRQAVISHAVTKGLNPDAPMRDSGVEWLGEVPEGWVLKNYRYATHIYRGKFGHRPRNDPAFYDGCYPFIQTGDVAQAGKKIREYKQTLNERGVSVSQKFPAGTLVMAIAANIGDTAILDFEAYAPDSVVGFKPNDDIDLEFLRYSLMAALPALEQTSTQSTQANLNIDRIGTVKAAFPPLAEQQQIVMKLDALHEQYSNTEDKALVAIGLMQERRTALISAAVTGKIDVRNWQAPASLPSETKGAVA